MFEFLLPKPKSPFDEKKKEEGTDWKKVLASLMPWTVSESKREWKADDDHFMNDGSKLAIADGKATYQTTAASRIKDVDGVLDEEERKKKLSVGPSGASISGSDRT